VMNPPGAWCSPDEGETVWLRLGIGSQSERGEQTR